ncbi:MAG: AAA family ATPase [Deltaproteobacteria bacterium]|nr:AAA family ATPase [Deltaproteobacteria bacterium]
MTTYETSQNGYAHLVTSGIAASGLPALFTQLAPGDFGLTEDTLYLLQRLKQALMDAHVAAEKMKYAISPLGNDGQVVDLSKEQKQFAGLFALKVFTWAMSDALSEKTARPNVEGAFELDGFLSLAAELDDNFAARISRLLCAFIKNDGTEGGDEQQTTHLFGAVFAFVLLLLETVSSVLESGRFKRFAEQVASHEMQIGLLRWKGVVPVKVAAQKAMLRPVSPKDIIGNETYLNAAMRLARDVAGYDFEQQKNPKDINPIIFALGPPGCGKTLVAHAVGNYFTEYCTQRDISSQFVIIRKNDWASSYQNASAQNLISIFQKLHRFNGVVGIYWADIDTALASRDQKSLRSEEKANLSSAFNIFDGTLIPFDGKWFMMCDANNLEMDEALRTRIARNPFNANGPETPQQYVQLFLDIQLKKVAKHIRCDDALWQEIGQMACDAKISGRAMEGLAKKVMSRVQDFEYPDDYFNASFEEKGQIIESCSKTVSGQEIRQMVEDYVRFEKEEEMRLSQKRFNDAVADAVFAMNVQKEVVAKELNGLNDDL